MQASPIDVRVMFGRTFGLNKTESEEEACEKEQAVAASKLLESLESIDLFVSLSHFFKFICFIFLFALYPASM